jgi:diguanylate cyclase (GGDEF)-like protein
MQKSTAAIYLDVHDIQRQTRWAMCLESAGFRCCAALAESPAPSSLDLILADHPVAPRNSTEESAFEPVRDPGILIVGHLAQADICLPADASDREIVLACSLLVQIVRLRHERRNEMQTRNTLLRLALTDSLTGLGNRRAWLEAMRTRWSAVRGTRMALCLMVLDLDGFKRLNDLFGHAAGDRALEIAGEVLAAEVRRDDFVARLGGDEFGLLLVGVDPESTATVVERVRAKLSRRLSAEAAAPLTASAGFAVACDPELPSSESLLALADQALQSAKRLGRNRTVAASALMSAVGCGALSVPTGLTDELAAVTA